MIYRLLLRVIAAGIIIALLADAAAAAGPVQRFAAPPERRGIGLLAPDERGILAQPPQTDQEPFGLDLDPDRSLFVHHADRLEGISFKAIMDRLGANSGTDADDLFNQWWRTLGPGDDAAVKAGTACPNEAATTAVTALNGFPMLCDERLAALADLADPFETKGQPHFIVIGAVNRGDLALQKTDCGEYRLIVALNPAWTEGRPAGIGDIYINFEAGIGDADEDEKMCEAIQRFWAGLSEVQPADGSIAARKAADRQIADALVQFFLKGSVLTEDGELLDAASTGKWPLPPVISVDNLGTEGTRAGQVRINTRTGGQLWVLREFAFRSAGKDKPRLLPTPTDAATDLSVFDGPATALGKAFAEQMDTLTTADLEIFKFKSPEALDASQHIAGVQIGDTPRYVYEAQHPVFDALVASLNDPDRLKRLQFVRRFESLTCAGCHTFSNGTGDMGFRALPANRAGSLGFTHISAAAVAGEYPLSNALRCMFLPRRQLTMLETLGATLSLSLIPTPGNCPGFARVTEW